MKLCQKCLKGILDAHDLSTLFDRRLLYSKNTEVPEPECEFWAHKKLNEPVTFSIDYDPAHYHAPTQRGGAQT